MREYDNIMLQSVWFNQLRSFPVLTTSPVIYWYNPAAPIWCDVYVWATTTVKGKWRVCTYCSPFRRFKSTTSLPRRNIRTPGR